MKVLLTGGTGFVGSHVLSALLRAGHNVRLLARQGAGRKLKLEETHRESVEFFPGDATLPESLVDAARDCDAVVHLIGIIREFPARGVNFERLHFDATVNVLETAISHGVGRFVHMSALGTRPGAPSPYHQTKWRAEQEVIGSGIPYVIFRPSVIFGPGDGFVNLLKGKILRGLPFAIPGSGRNRLQPVSVRDVAEAFAQALTRDDACGRVFEVGGPESFMLSEIVDLIAAAKGLAPPAKIHIPLGLLEPIVGILESFPFFPLSVAQLQMIREDNVCDEKAFAETFKVDLVPFREGIKEYVR